MPPHRQRLSRFPFPLLPRCFLPMEMTPVDRPAALPDSGVAPVFFTPDDTFYDLPETAALPDCAVALLARAGSWSARNKKDGFVPASKLAGFTSDPVQASDALVRCRWWRRAKGGFQFTDWPGWLALEMLAELEAEDPEEAARVQRKRASDARRQALFRDQPLKHAIRTRDADRCRYCSVAVRWGKGRAPDSGAFDHIDPKGPNTLENLVVACCSCNSIKKDRTPEEAGMRLLDPPKTNPPQPRNASRNASKGDRNGNADPYRSDLDLDFNQGSEGQSVNQVEDRNAGAGTREKPAEPEPRTWEFRLQVQGEMAARGYDDVTDAEADGITAEVLGRAKEPVPHPLGYVRKAVKGAKDPYARWLSKRPPKPAAILAEFSPAIGPHEFKRDPETGGCVRCKEPQQDKIHRAKKAAVS